MICHIVFVLIPQPWNSHQQPVFSYVWHMSSLRVSLFMIEFMSLSYTKSCIKIAYILYYSQKFVPHPFLGANFSSQHYFLWRLTSPSSTLSPLFIFKYWPVYMTEATLNANNYIDICSIPSKFHICMYERMKNIYAQNQSSIHCPCVWKAVHNRTFWIILVRIDGESMQELTT